MGDFEKYMQYILQLNAPFTLEAFVAFSTSLVNFYTGSQLIATSERNESALFLCRLFNAGLGNQINEEDLKQISALIVADQGSLDYTLLQPVFS